MSSRNKRITHQAERAGTPANGRQEVSSRLARWLLPVMGLVFAGAILTIFILRNNTGDRRSVGTAPEKEIQKAPLMTGTNQPLFTSAGTNPQPAITSALTNHAGAETEEDRVVALVTEGNQFLAQGNYAEAAQRYEHAVRIDPGDEGLHYNLAIALAKLGKIEEAKKHYAEALQIFPDYADAHNNLGNQLMMEKKLAEATDHFREAVRIMPDNAAFHNNLGTALGLQSKAAEAMGAFEAAVRLKPDYVDARVNLANACLATGRVEESVAQLTEALRLKPDYQPALQTLRRARQKQ